ncbi:hypothetical protein GCM10009613_18890 [Pseudonocardia kongjuensis]|uniref:Uncharacterized protein n=1 Tax=Pseudonocardia kongjuensis TaxID=102227 RepID=A0ABN1XN10_9PSEU
MTARRGNGARVAPSDRAGGASRLTGRRLRSTTPPATLNTDVTGPRVVYRITAVLGAGTALAEAH